MEKATVVQEVMEMAKKAESEEALITFASERGITLNAEQAAALMRGEVPDDALSDVSGGVGIFFAAMVNEEDDVKPNFI
jgi:hypothetical protein